ncbi:tRNA threonylcarbamoyladenosine biosynthesis protein [Fictibacillus phosphorivorans]|uniref:Threonylcarbamoyl-AMP synthase n=1 Tax=Fictibacillus phosphorivorans TaxID=1221500 RepID=A0A160IR64_9BACL|nr:L-threonylcarbamoyladenylate synthase [Fictibacillus phosphorivorans]ANC78983.1 tRNA threonylcarbamoyladenosine biosynthesis protein [Fictibacillus phosphorivorans]
MKSFQTERWAVDKTENTLENHPHIIQASLWINKNEVIAIPTETVYGLAGNARSDDAIKRIFEAKGRPSDNPLIVHISDLSQLEGLVSSVSETAQKLMNAFWPGPLTIVLPKGENVSERVTAGLSTVAVRMPDHEIALAVIAASGVPLAAPSANLSGKPSPTSAQHVYEDLKGRIPGIVDGGSTGVGVESTVVECTGELVTILRPGGITLEELEKVAGAGRVVVDPGLENEKQAPKSPGMKYTHYAPDAPFVLVDGSVEFLQRLVDKEREAGKRIGILTTEERAHVYKADCVIPAGDRSNPESVAQHLYEALRAFNEAGVDQIFGEVFPKTGVGVAIMNRLEKSAGGNIIKE